MSDTVRGAFSGLLVALALETAFRPVYTTTVAPQRLALSVMLVGLAAPAFAATCRAASWVGGGSGLLARGVSVEAVLAALTALLTPWLFMRMSMLPAFVFALVLLFAAAYRAGTRSTAGAAAFGAVMYARTAAVVCAFY